MGEAPFVSAVSMVIVCVLMSHSNGSHDGVLDGVYEGGWQRQLATMFDGCLVGVDQSRLMVSLDQHCGVVGSPGGIIDRLQRVKCTMLENVFKQPPVRVIL